MTNISRSLSADELLIISENQLKRWFICIFDFTFLLLYTLLLDINLVIKKLSFMSSLNRARQRNSSMQTIPTSQQQHNPQDPSENANSIWRTIGDWMASNLKTAIFLIIPFLMLAVFMASPAPKHKNAGKNIANTSNVVENIFSDNRSNKYETMKNKVKEIEESLKSGTYRSSDKYRYLSSRTDTNQNASQMKLIYMADKASFQLQKPDYPNYLNQIMLTQSYQQLPFCLITKLTKTNTPQHKQLISSIFNLKYINMITIFLTDNQAPSEKQFDLILKQSYKTTIISQRRYYRINYTNASYYDYRYLLRQMCEDNAYVVFVSSPLVNTALGRINSIYQLFPVFLLYSRTSQFHHVNSFAMRLFDLIGINDFGGTNEKYLQLSNQENFLAVALLELSKKITKKLPITEIFVQFQPSSWMTGVASAENTIYKRQPYQPLNSLSQTYSLSSLPTKTQENKTPDPKTQLTQDQMNRAIQYQQILYLPDQYSLNHRQQVNINNTYGVAMREYRPYQVNITQMPICAIIINLNNSHPTTYQKQRYLNNIQSLLRQKYTNYRLIYLDDGVQNQTMQLIQQRIKHHLENGFPTDKFVYVRNNVSKFMVENTIKAAYQYCGEDDTMVVVNSQFQVIGTGFLTMLNYVSYYNPNIWVFNTNYKSDQNSYGIAYRINNQYEYRKFDTRVPNVRALAPVLIVKTKVLRNIPLEYLQGNDDKWFKDKWYEALTHSIMELATVGHMEYIPQISFQCSDEFYQKFIANPQFHEQTIYINNKKPLMPLRFLNKVSPTQQQVISALKKH